MRIHNVRAGFATNSSSTHSIVFLREPAQDHLVANGEFGWGHFTAASPQAKARYLGVLVYEALRASGFDHAFARRVTCDLVGGGIDPMRLGSYPISEHDYIDHQSLKYLPQAWSGHGLDLDFFAAFKSYLMRENVAVLGGNDNNGMVHPLLAGAERTRLDTYPEEERGLVARHEGGEHWTLFNRDSGQKVRFAFDDSPRPKLAAAPELVDLKLTSHCMMGCAYCHQDSTPAGKHAEIPYNLVSTLAEMRVFEVAIGGGEPVTHPGFVTLLECFRAAGVVPNFTTRDLSWLSDGDRRGRVLNAVGAFAFSADTVDQLDRLRRLMDRYDVDARKVSVQYVAGQRPAPRDGIDLDLSSILRACAERGVRVTILGPKSDGRGGVLKALDGGSRQALATVLDARARTKSEGYRTRYLGDVAVDTKLLADVGKEALSAAGVHGRLYTAKEGVTSCYIDLVAGTMSRASYGPQERVGVRKWNEEGLRAAWQLVRQPE